LNRTRGSTRTRLQGQVMERDNVDIVVTEISAPEAEPWLLSRHYARRLCPISYAFGAWQDSKLQGVITYGTPASSPLRSGVCGEVWESHVVELNRLCCNSIKNLASILVGRSLSMLPKPLIVVSYADLEQGHVGYVYQATNFLYTGLSAKRTDWAIKGLEHLHGATIADESRGKENRAAWMREKYGDAFYLKERSRKHRYIYFCGNNKQKKQMRSALRYTVESYPKGDTRRYDASAKIDTQMRLL
jgi:hypothetical protein